MFRTVCSTKKKDILCLEICAVVINLGLAWRIFDNPIQTVQRLLEPPPPVCWTVLFPLLPTSKGPTEPANSGRPPCLANVTMSLEALPPISPPSFSRLMELYLTALLQSAVVEHFRRVCWDCADAVFVPRCAGSERADRTVARLGDEWTF